MGFVHDWKKALGYKSNPFVAWPRKHARDFIIDREKERERLNLFVIKNERFGIIHGPRGAGKSLLARWLSEEVRQKVLFIDAEKSKKEHFADYLLKLLMPLIERKLRKVHELQAEERHSLLIERLRKKKFLIVVDNAQIMSKESKALLQELFVICSEGQFLLVLERLLKEYESWPFILELSEMTLSSLKSLIAKRIELAGGVGTHPFSDKDLEQLINKAKKNPARLLNLASERAIELSLTAGPPPRPVKPAQSGRLKKAAQSRQSGQLVLQNKKSEGRVVNQTGAEQRGSKPKKKWFSIKIVDDWDGESSSREVLDEGLLKSSTAEETMTLQNSEQQKDIQKDYGLQQDADMLNEIVEQATKSDEKSSSSSKSGEFNAESDVKEVIKTLVEELNEGENHD